MNVISTKWTAEFDATVKDYSSVSLNLSHRLDSVLLLADPLYPCMQSTNKSLVLVISKIQVINGECVESFL